MNRTGSRTHPQASGIGKGASNNRSVSPAPTGETPANASANATPSKGQGESEDRAEERKVAGAAGNVAVYCRFRPLNEKERAMGEA